MYNTFSKLQIEHTKEILREMVKARSPSQRKRGTERGETERD